MAASTTQLQSIDFQTPENLSFLERILCTQRNVFLSSEIDSNSKTGKTNAFEANLISELVFSFQRIYDHNNRSFEHQSIGIITPYRAQIAQIRKALSEKSIDPRIVNH